jgi:hypothetical protein
MNRSIYRNERVFHVDDTHGDQGGWYFEVRGAEPRGPYTTRRLAETALAEYLHQMPDTPRSQDTNESEDEGG